jgi:hypothetical protein
VDPEGQGIGGVAGWTDWNASVWVHNAYEVGEYNSIKKLSVRDVREANHAPQTGQARSLIGSFKEGRGTSISLPKEQHDLISYWQNNRRDIFGRLPTSARELLAQDIRLHRMFSDAPRSSLLEIIKNEKSLNFWDYLPLHRMGTI